MNTESPPVIPIESHSHRIPAFFQLLCHSQEIPTEINSLIEIQPCSRTPKNHCISATCKCPHVLVSDDDPFQEFFYLSLFKKVAGSCDNPAKAGYFRMSVVRSGEELLKKYSSSQKKCGCGSCQLVITDYDMGRENLNGIETSLALRKVGYMGSVILRTSEKEEDLQKIHPNFKKLLENKTIDSLHEKKNIVKIQETVHNFLKRQDLLF